MFFTVENKYNLPIDILKSRILFNARSLIVMWPMKTTELALEKQIQKNFRVTFKTACAKVLTHCSIAVIDNEVVITFKEPQIDELASLITYGINELPGSKILKKAFSYK